MAVLDILEISRQGMQANRQALQTTSNNIANANTPGYSRQNAVFQNNPSNFVNNRGFGGGVEIKKVVRSHDELVERQLLDELKTFGTLKTRANQLHQVEGILQNESMRMGELLNGFFNDARQLSTSPEIPALRSNLVRSAQNTAEGFKKVSDSLDTMKIGIDERIRYGVEEVNRITHEIAHLNQGILHLRSSGEEPNELLDRREALLRELAGKIDYTSFEDQTGRTSVIAAGFGVLVQGDERMELGVSMTPSRALKGPGSVDVFVRGHNGERPVSHLVRGGELGGLLFVRDEIINPAMQHVDTLAYEFSRAVNDVHRKGKGLDGSTGLDLFNDNGKAQDAAHNLEVSDSIVKNPNAVATGYDNEALGDNTIALEIADIQNAKLMPRFMQAKVEGEELEDVDDPLASSVRNPTQTLNESMNNLVGEVGVHTKGDEQLMEHQEAIVNQLENYRQTISGVSLEEEAVNMMQFQAVFNASAKALKMGDELFQVVLSLKA